jgi:hypothetical protein
MASVSAIRDGLADRLGTIPGLRVSDTVPGQVSTPAVIIKPGARGRDAIVFDQTFGRGSDALTFSVMVLVSTASDRTAQDALDAYLAGEGEMSVKEAIEEEDTLGQIVSFAHVTGVREYGLVEYGGVHYLGADFTIEVTT